MINRGNNQKAESNSFNILVNESSGNVKITVNDHPMDSLDDALEMYNSIIPTVLQKVLKKIDNEVNSLFPDGIISKKHIGKHQEFNSSRMISSLGQIGIPIDASFKILNKAIAYIKTLPKGNLTALDIRRAVANSIPTVATHYDSNRHNSLLWADFYTRRYGDPDNRIIIVGPGNKSYELEYKFIENVLLREIFRSVYKNPINEFSEAVSSADKKRMVKEVFELVKALNIYRLNYSTLLQLVTEYVLHPPHPWFVHKESNIGTVVYDFKKATEHWEKIESYKKNEDWGSVIACVKEVIHHSCSGLLANYGIIMGCGENSTLVNLQRVISSIINNDYDFESSYSNIDKLVSDINTYEIKIDEFAKKLKDLWNLLCISINSTEDKIDKYINTTSTLLNDYIKKLLSARLRLQEIRNAFINLENTRIEYFQMMKIGIENLSCFKISGVVNFKFIWAVHSIKEGLFNDIAPRVLFMLSFNEDETTSHKNCISTALKKVNNSRAYRGSNAFIIISNREVHKNEKEYLASLVEEGIYGAIIPMQSYIRLVASEEYMKKISTIFK